MAVGQKSYDNIMNSSENKNQRSQFDFFQESRGGLEVRNARVYLWGKFAG